MSPLFSILLPVTRPPVLLPLAIESVLAQSVADFELLVVCDGAPSETIACAQEYRQRDDRVKVLAFPKGERHGEAYRHSALEASSARYVAHICDDDIWFPNHLAEMEILLSQVDFGNLIHVYIHTDGAIELLPGNLGDPETRRRMLTERLNIFGLTYAGYRMDAYRGLPEGWAPAPLDVWTDLHMWRKFLAMESLTFATRAVVTALHFATPDRLHATLVQREEENRAYLARIQNFHDRDEIVEAAWHSVLDKVARNNEQIAALGTSREALEAELNQMTIARDVSQTENEILARTYMATQSQRAELEAELGRVTVTRDIFQSENEALTRNLTATQSELATLEAELSRVTVTRDVFESENETLTRKLTAKQTELDLMLRSKSWRLTAPLRALMAKAKRPL